MLVIVLAIVIVLGNVIVIEIVIVNLLCAVAVVCCYANLLNLLDFVSIKVPPSKKFGKCKSCCDTWMGI